MGDYGDPQIDLRIVNNSEKSYTIQERDFSVNDILTDTIFSPDVAPGKTAIDEIKIEQTSLEKNGIANIDQIQKIDFTFHIFNSDDWNDTFDSAIITLPPNGSDATEMTSPDSQDGVTEGAITNPSTPE